MKIGRPATYGIAFAGVLSLAHSHASAESLGELLRESNWDRVIGTWVDADTKGEVITTTYAWKIEDRVVEITTQEANKESVALMGVNAKSGEVFHMGADSEGASSLGKWELDGRDAVLGLVYTTGEGQEGALSIRHHLEDENTMSITIELPQPIRVTMVKEKPTD